MTVFSAPRDSRELRIIHYKHAHPELKRANAFRLNRSRSLPHALDINTDTILDIAHNVSEATIAEVVDNSEHNSPSSKEKKEACCTKHKVAVWVAIITAGGIACTSIMTTIVTLVIHFAK